MNKRIFLLPLVVIFLLMHSTYAHSQSADCDYTSAMMYDGWGFDVVTGESCEPFVCETTQRDPDGDGFGPQDGHICTVTDESLTAPSRTNRETGLPVVFTPAYWDANKDIANRMIQCDSYYFDEIAGLYVLEDESYIDEQGDFVYTSNGFFHHPVSPADPFEGWVDTLRSENAPVWSVENGVYRGLAPLSVFPDSANFLFALSPESFIADGYLEVVSPPNSGKRVRLWVSAGDTIGPRNRDFGSRARRDGYVECRDTLGADFEPTGAPGAGTTVNHQLQEIEFSPEITNATRPTIINAATGVEVNLISPVWNYNKDIANKRIECAAFVFVTTDFGSPRGNHWTLPFVYEDSPDVLGYHFGLFPDDIQRLNEWSFVDGIPTDVNGSPILNAILEAEYLEVADRGVRSWAPDGESYTQCTLFPSETVTSIQQTSAPSPQQDESTVTPQQDENIPSPQEDESAAEPQQDESTNVEDESNLDTAAEDVDDVSTDNNAPVNNNESTDLSNIDPIIENTDDLSLMSSSGGGSIGGKSLLYLALMIASRRKLRRD